MFPLIRSATLTGYVELAESVGLDPYRLMREAGLSRSCLRDPDTKIPVIAVRRLLEASAQAAGVDDFGLRLARTRRLSNLGPIGLAVHHEPTARKALETLTRYMRLHNESLFTRIEEANGLVVIREELAEEGQQSVRQSMELAVGVVFRILRELLGPSWEPREVCFTHPAPASLASHLEVFGRFVAFGCEFNGFICAAKDLDARIPSSDPVLARYARQYLDAMFARPNMTTKDKVRQLVSALLPSGHCSIERVAEHIGVDRRTVHRHLALTGDTFTSVVDAVRGELAARYIESRDRPLAEVADLLGFSAQSTFARWFREKFSCSASDWRRRHLKLKR